MKRTRIIVPKKEPRMTLLFLCLLFLMPGLTSINAKERSREEMRSIAAQAINSHLKSMRQAPRHGVLTEYLTEEGVTILGYENGGFAVVTHDDALPAVVGYSSATYSQEDENPAFHWWLSSIGKAAEYYSSNGLRPRHIAPDPKKYQPSVLPLLSTEWGQEAPYNQACPIRLDGESYPRHSVVGCVATALGQILNYHHYPNKTKGGTASLQVPYNDPRGETVTFDFDHFTIDWSHMRDTYSVGNYSAEEADAVSQLCFALGMASQMQYSLEFSGAISDDAVNGLQTYFGISTATLHTRQNLLSNEKIVSDEEWMSMVFGELSNMCPIYYAGADNAGEGGHAFVIDGYDADGLVHVNWGWYGRFGGYYNIDLLNPRIYHFSIQQEMITGIVPPAKATKTKASVNVNVPGTLSTLLSDSRNLGQLTITGTLDAADFATLRSLPSVETIDMHNANIVDDVLPSLAFSGLTTLHNLALPSSMKDMGDGALANIPNINALVIPEDDNKEYVIADGVVYNRAMTDVIAVLPTTIDSVNIAKGVKHIHAHALEGLKRVRIVSLPAGIESIGSRAFSDVTILRELHVKDVEPPLADPQCFADADPGFIALFIPAGSRTAYQKSTGWKDLFRSDNVYETGTVVKARNAIRKYGEENPTFYYQILGEHVSGIPVLTCEATKTSPAGRYPIKVSLGTINAEDVTLVDGYLIVEGGPTELVDTDDECGVMSLEGKVADKELDVWSLDGRFVKHIKSQPSEVNLQKGIYIINGKKHVVK